MNAQIWQAGRFQLDLGTAKIMGVLNCTPDSFSDGGQFVHPEAALERAVQMVAEGADIIDIGAESTRPGAKNISVAEELARLEPIVSVLVKELPVPISIDTKKTAVMRYMLSQGIDIINDINGFEDKDALTTVANSDCGLCIMHMRGTPQNMQDNTAYNNVVDEVSQYLQQRVDYALHLGIARERLIVDPGFGFAKTPEQNMQLIKDIRQCSMGLPALIGVSRKSTIGYYLKNAPIDARLYGSITLAALGVWLGASIVRVHDVRATRDALQIVEALKMI